MADQLAAGRVGRPHGLDGSFHVTGAVAGLLVHGMELTVDSTVHRIERLAGTAKAPIARLSGCADRSAAEALRGEALLVDASVAPALGPGEYRPDELVGCRVTDAETNVGEVTGVLALPSCEALEVRRIDGGELLVPLVSDAVRSVEVRERRIDVDMAFLGE